MTLPDLSTANRIPDKVCRLAPTPRQGYQGRMIWATIHALLRRALLALIAVFVLAGTAQALEAVRVTPDSDAIDLLPALEAYKSDEDRLTVQTAPGADGIVRRIEVQAREQGTRPSWIVFALKTIPTSRLNACWWRPASG